MTNKWAMDKPHAIFFLCNVQLCDRVAITMSYHSCIFSSRRAMRFDLDFLAGEGQTRLDTRYILY